MEFGQYLDIIKEQFVWLTNFANNFFAVLHNAVVVLYKTVVVLCNYSTLLFYTIVFCTLHFSVRFYFYHVYSAVVVLFLTVQL